MMYTDDTVLFSHREDTTEGAKELTKEGYEGINCNRSTVYMRLKFFCAHLETRHMNLYWTLSSFNTGLDSAAHH